MSHDSKYSDGSAASAPQSQAGSAAPGKSTRTAGLVQMKPAGMSPGKPMPPKGVTGGNQNAAVDAHAAAVVAIAQQNAAPGAAGAPGQAAPANASAASAPAAAGPAAAGGGAAANAPAAGGGAAASAAPVQHKAVQLDGQGQHPSADTVHAAAEQGTSGGGGQLPHLDAIQSSFGEAHDVSAVTAHVGGAAADACDTMGASAYASGDHVAFAGAPDLHTAAHEAAHVVQQRAGVQLYGGVGEVGDSYEQHADAVADRVVAGQSAADLLSGSAAGAAPGEGGGNPNGNGGGVQRKVVQRELAASTGITSQAGANAFQNAIAGHPGGQAPAGAGPSRTGVDHYKVEIKAWIPHGHVVDPEEPMRASDWLDTLTSFQIPTLASLKYDFHSHYRGDAHSGYVGTHRAIATVEFDYDGTTISHVVQGAVGATETHRDWDYRAYIETAFGLGPDIELTSGSGTETGPVGGGCSGVASGSGAHLAISAANKLVMTFAPAINDDYDVSPAGASGITLHYSTDEFPSHGYQVSKNGAVVKTDIVNDASGVYGEGPIGAAIIGKRLSSQSNSGTATIP